MIYIVEDDENIRQLESYALRNSGYETEEFGDVNGFFERCGEALPARPETSLLPALLTQSRHILFTCIRAIHMV